MPIIFRLAIEMDISVFEKSDLESRLRFIEYDAIKKNLVSNKVLIRVMLGGSNGRQNAEVTRALFQVEQNFRLKRPDLTVCIESFTNDQVKNTLKWSVDELITKLIESDVHVVACALHEGNVGKTVKWNIPNILDNLDRLEHHLGAPMGKYIRCPVFRSDKAEVYKHLFSANLCVPTIEISIELESISSLELDIVKRFEICITM